MVEYFAPNSFKKLKAIAVDSLIITITIKVGFRCDAFHFDINNVLGPSTALTIYFNRPTHLHDELFAEGEAQNAVRVVEVGMSVFI